MRGQPDHHADHPHGNHGGRLMSTLITLMLLAVAILIGWLGGRE